MAAIELKAELYRQIDTMADDESLLEKVLSFVRKLTTTSVPAVTPYTMDELNQRIDKSLEDLKAGRTKKNEEVEKLLLKEFEWLR